MTSENRTDTSASIPRLLAALAWCARWAAWRSAFEGTQPVHVQSPPSFSRSMSIVLTPALAAMPAAVSPAAPPPITM